MCCNNTGLNGMKKVHTILISRMRPLQRVHVIAHSLHACSLWMRCWHASHMADPGLNVASQKQFGFLLNFDHMDFQKRTLWKLKFSQHHDLCATWILFIMNRHTWPSHASWILDYIYIYNIYVYVLYIYICFFWVCAWGIWGFAGP